MAKMKPEDRHWHTSDCLSLERNGHWEGLDWVYGGCSCGLYDLKKRKMPRKKRLSAEIKNETKGGKE